MGINLVGMIWREQVRKALISLPVYLGIGLSLALLLELIRSLVVPGQPRHPAERSLYEVLFVFALILWLIRQFVRFWYTVFVETRERY